MYSEFEDIKFWGGVLRPLLFVIYINDLPEDITSDALLFADESKLFRQITSMEDPHILQYDTDSFRGWSEKWLLRVNLLQMPCSHIWEYNAHTPLQYVGKWVEHVFEENDLGVTIEVELRFEEHIVWLVLFCRGHTTE